jgi:hypothetical protein
MGEIDGSESNIYRATGLARCGERYDLPGTRLFVTGPRGMVNGSVSGDSTRNEALHSCCHRDCVSHCYCHCPHPVVGSF